MYNIILIIINIYRAYYSFSEAQNYVIPFSLFFLAVLRWCTASQKADRAVSSQLTGTISEKRAFPTTGLLTDKISLSLLLLLTSTSISGRPPTVRTPPAVDKSKWYICNKLNLCIYCTAYAYIFTRYVKNKVSLWMTPLPLSLSPYNSFLRAPLKFLFYLVSVFST